MTRALLLIAATLTLFAATEASAQDAIDAELAPNGKLRYGLNESNAALEVTASQKACQPPLADCHTIAANGSSTIRELVG